MGESQSFLLCFSKKSKGGRVEWENKMSRVNGVIMNDWVQKGGSDD